jgi:hypothetical protein
MRCIAYFAAAMLAVRLLPAASIDPTLLGLVPNDTQILAGVQISQSRNSSFGQYLLLQAAKQEPQFQKLLDATGFDPRRDLQEVLIATWSTGRTATHHPSLAIARGTFDIARIKQAFTDQGGRVQTLNGIDVLFGKGRGDGAVAFLDNTLALAGDSLAVQNAAAHYGTPTTINPQLTAKVNQVSRDHEAWFASILPAASLPAVAHLGAENQQMNGAVLQSVIQSFGGLHFGANTVDVALDATTKTDQDAQSLADVVRFLASMVQMQRQNQPVAALLAPSLDTMQLNATGSEMSLGLSIPEDVMEKLINQNPAVAIDRAPKPARTNGRH